MSTLYATFKDIETAERAAGALFDQGADKNDISIVANIGSSPSGNVIGREDAGAEEKVSSGLTTTTAADVAVGAAKGATVGAGLGALAVLATLFVPGLGLVLGGGALATALAGAVGAAAAGTAAGGVVGYLKDQGVSEEYVTKYSDALYQGGTLLSLTLPSGSLDVADAEGVLAKYGAMNVGSFYHEPTPFATPAATVSVPGTVPIVSQDVSPTPVSAWPASDAAIAQGAKIDADEMAVTPAGQVVTPSGTVDGTPIASPIGPQVMVAKSAPTNDPLEPSTTVVVDPNTGVRRSVTMDPTTGVETVAVVDPVTGEAIPNTVVSVQTQDPGVAQGQTMVGALQPTQVGSVPVVPSTDLTDPAFAGQPVVDKVIAVDASGQPLGEVETLEDQTVVVEPKAKLL